MFGPWNVRRDRAEVYRLAGRLVLFCEFRVGDVRVGRSGRDGRKVALAEDRRHGLAGSAHHRSDRRDDPFVGHHLARVGRSLPRVVLACRRGAIVEDQHVELVTRDLVLGVDLIERHQCAVLDAIGGLCVGAGERQIETDPDHLVGGLGGDAARCSGEGGGGEKLGGSPAGQHVMSPC